MTSASDDTTGFPTLEPADIAAIAELGTRRAVRPDEYLYRSGDESYDFYVVVSGAVDIVLDDDGTGAERVITQHGAGRFLGELNLLTGSRVFVSAGSPSPARSSPYRSRSFANSWRPTGGWAR